jgi:SPOR domain
MADDPIQRAAYRASQPPVRNAPGAAAGSAPGSDPLAELARLIGQNDPFGEFGRLNGRNAAPANDLPGYPPSPARDLRAPPPQVYADDRYPAPIYVDDDYAAPGEGYPAPAFQDAPFPPPPAPPPQYGQQDQHAQQEYDPAYPQDPYAEGIVPGQDGLPGYEQGSYYPNSAHAAAEDEHFYDDAPPRRRIGVLVIAAVLGLAVIGTAGAFGYRTLFGSSGKAAAPPPVIKADATPRKIVPAAQSKDPQAGKLIYDRINNNQNEKVVSREEQPVDIKDKAVGTLMPQGQQASIGSGVIGVEPKKVHTIAIHPTQPDGVPAAQAAAPAPPPAPPTVPARAQSPAAPPAPPAIAEAQPRQVGRVEPKVTRPQAAASGSAPLSLSPNAAPPAVQPRPARIAAAPVQTAPARTATPAQIAPAASGAGGYAVQIVSRHNEADAKASFQSLQSKFSQQLGGRTPMIRRVDLGAKGIYYRALVGPFGSADEASHLCSNLKAAGGDCLVQRI